MTLTIRLTLIAVAVVVASVCLTAILNLLKFEQVMDELEQRRYHLAASDMARVAEQHLGLGLPLSAIDNMEALLARQMNIDPSITGIMVLDANSKVLYRELRLAPELKTQLEGVSKHAELVLSRDHTEGINQAAITNSFGRVMGRVVVRHSLAARIERRHAIMQILAIGVVGATLAGFLITAVAASQLLSPVRKRLAGILDLIDMTASGHTTAKNPTVDGDEFVTMASLVLADVRALERDIDREQMRKAAPET